LFSRIAERVHAPGGVDLEAGHRVRLELVGSHVEVDVQLVGRRAVVGRLGEDVVGTVGGP
jgi:hypothetical protein